MKNLTQFLLAFVIVQGALSFAWMLGAAPVHASGPWYVAPGGSDNNDCLGALTPCATISAAMGKASSGDTVNVASGTYTRTGSQVVLVDKTISLAGGWDGAFAAQTGASVIDGQAARYGITVNGGVAASIDRFSVKNGFSTGFGGGIYNSGSLSITNSSVISNYSQIGGGIVNFASLYIDNTRFSSNFGYGGGGAIYSAGLLNASNSTFDGNRSTGWGGGIDVDGSVANLTNNTFINNTTTGSGGGAIMAGDPGASVKITNSTFYSNSAPSGGAIFTLVPLTVTNSTFSGNRAPSGSGGALYVGFGSMAVRNSILANSTAGGNCGGPITSQGNNIDTGSTCGLNAAGDMTNTNPSLVALADYGGATSTMALLPGSAAIDAANAVYCPATDQRNYGRIGACDIGSVEWHALDLSSKSASPLNSAPGATVVYTITLTNSGLSPLSSILVTDTLPSSVNYNNGTLTASSGTPTISNGLVTWSGSINNGASVKISFAATVTNSQPYKTTIVNTAQFTGSVDLNTRSASVYIPRPIALGPWYVATGGSDGNVCNAPIRPCASINGALNQEDFASGDTIYVAGGTYTGTGSEVALVNKSANLSGGWNAGFSTQNLTSTIDGENSRRPLTVNSGLSATMDRFIARNGWACGGGGVRNSGTLLVSNSTVISNYVPPSTSCGGYAFGGGGMENGGNLTLMNTQVISNLAGFGAGIDTATGSLVMLNSTVMNNLTFNFGGGINSMGGSVILTNSIIANNFAGMHGGGIRTVGGALTLNYSGVYSNVTGIYGGGIENGGGLVMNNSTVSGNSAVGAGASGEGGGIFNQGTAYLNNSTVTNNSADGNGAGGGLFNYVNDVYLKNTIIAGNKANWQGPDCMTNTFMGVAFVSSGYNLIGASAGCAFTPAAADISNTFPYLDALKDNGGATLTHALLAPSPAINHGNPSGCQDHLGNALTTDQRGFLRVGRCDMGAFEYQPPPPPSAPVKNYLPLVAGGATSAVGIHGRVTFYGAPAARTYLELRRWNGSAYSTQASTTTDSNGGYSFVGAPPLGAGEGYYVRYVNGADSFKLSFWGTKLITAYAAGSSVSIGDFDLMDIPLSSPGGTVSLPQTFNWTRRLYFTTDSYEFHLFNPNNPPSFTPAWGSAPQGWMSFYALNSLPGPFSTSTPYGWFVAVNSPDQGYGESYYYIPITFSNVGVRPGQLAPARRMPIEKDIVFPRKSR